MSDSHYDQFDDTATESYRREQGKPPQPTPKERMEHVPLAFGTGGTGPVVGGGPVPDDATATPNPEAAENQRAVEEGANWLESEKGE